MSTVIVQPLLSSYSSLVLSRNFQYRHTIIVRRLQRSITSKRNSSVVAVTATINATTCNTTPILIPKEQQQQHQDYLHIPYYYKTAIGSSSSSHHRHMVTITISTPGDNNNLSISDSTLQSRITELAKEPQTSVSLNALMKTGRGEYLHKTFGQNYMINTTTTTTNANTTNNTNNAVMDTTGAATDLVLIQVAGFLRRELPIRMAHRIQDLEGIPVLRDMESVKLVRDLYIKSIQDIINFDTKITTKQQENDFSLIIERIYERHSSVLVQMARGAYEFRQAVRSGATGTTTSSSSSSSTTSPSSSSTSSSNEEFELQVETHAFLDRFYLCRIGIRVLIGQYLALRQPAVPNYIGIICSHTSPYEIVKRAIDDAAFMCTRIYGDSPEVIMSGRLDLSFPYVPTHLRMYLYLLCCVVLCCVVLCCVMFL
jgi:Mitochondrial branched-chain alpha-ketoacid dehydrogenase kinase